MSIQPKKNKSTSRRKKTEPSVPGIHNVPKEVVEIERNIIENWLISIKQWFQVNTETARKIIFGVLIAIVLIFIGVFVHSAMIDNQNSKFYRILIQYENLKKNTNDPDYNKKITEIRENALKLCQTKWSTQYSNAGCLMAALLSNELKEYENAATYLSKFANKTSNEGFSSYATLISGLLFESGNKPEESLKLYKDLIDQLDGSSSKDIALYHYGRMLYDLKKYDEAAKSFQEILDNYKNSIYMKKAKDYLLLIAIQ